MHNITGIHCRRRPKKINNRARVLGLSVAVGFAHALYVVQLCGTQRLSGYPKFKEKKVEQESKSLGRVSPDTMLREYLEYVSCLPTTRRLGYSFWSVGVTNTTEKN